MSLEPRLGPMTRQDLEDLARAGGILETDSIRQGENGQWRAASQIRGLFKSASVPDARVERSAVPGETAPGEPVPASRVSPSKLTRPRHKAADRTIRTKTERPATDAKVPEQPPVETDELAAELNALFAPSADDALRDLGELDFQLNLPEKNEAAVPPPLPARTEKANRGSAVSSVRQPASIEPSPPLPPPQPPPAAALRPLPPPISTAGPAPRPSSQPRRTTKPASRWLFPVIGLTVLGLIVVAAGFWLRSAPEGDIYSRFSQIFREWRQHRSGKANTAWLEFAEPARREVEASLLRLEEHVEPGNRQETLLLFAGRDLLEALGHPPDREAPHEKRLVGFFEQLDQAYAAR